jgi:hypothetical protein
MYNLVNPPFKLYSFTANRFTCLLEAQGGSRRFIEKIYAQKMELTSFG